MRESITAGRLKSGKWVILATPDVPVRKQQAILRDLKHSRGKCDAGQIEEVRIYMRPTMRRLFVVRTGRFVDDRPVGKAAPPAPSATPPGATGAPAGEAAAAAATASTSTPAATTPPATRARQGAAGRGNKSKQRG